MSGRTLVVGVALLAVASAVAGWATQSDDATGRPESSSLAPTTTTTIAPAPAEPVPPVTTTEEAAADPAPAVVDADGQVVLGPVTGQLTGLSLVMANYSRGIVVDLDTGQIEFGDYEGLGLLVPVEEQVLGYWTGWAPWTLAGLGRAFDGPNDWAPFVLAPGVDGSVWIVAESTTPVVASHAILVDPTSGDELVSRDIPGTAIFIGAIGSEPLVVSVDGSVATAAHDGSLAPVSPVRPRTDLVGLVAPRFTFGLDCSAGDRCTSVILDTTSAASTPVAVDPDLISTADHLAVGPDGATAVAHIDGETSIVSTRAGQTIATLPRAIPSPTSGSWSPTGSWFVQSLSDPDVTVDDCPFVLVDLTTGDLHPFSLRSVPCDDVMPYLIVTGTVDR